MTNKKPKIQKIASPAATLRGMTRGETMLVPNREIRTSSLRSAAARLRSHGYQFKINEKDYVNEALVMCLKSPK